MGIVEGGVWEKQHHSPVKNRIHCSNL